MIITKPAHQFKGYIEYHFSYSSLTRFTGDVPDEDSCFESDNFLTLDEMIQKMSPEALERIKEEYGAEKVWIGTIGFFAESEDKKTTSKIFLEKEKCHGHVATEIQNEDIQNRLLLNIQHIKKIIDNTLEQYPVKY